MFRELGGRHWIATTLVSRYLAEHRACDWTVIVLPGERRTLSRAADRLEPRDITTCSGRLAAPTGRPCSSADPLSGSSGHHSAGRIQTGRCPFASGSPISVRLTADRVMAASLYKESLAAWRDLNDAGIDTDRPPANDCEWPIRAVSSHPGSAQARERGMSVPRFDTRHS